MPIYKTIGELRKLLDLSHVPYTEEMSHDQLQAMVDAMPLAPGDALAAKLPQADVDEVTRVNDAVGVPRPPLSASIQQKDEIIDVMQKRIDDLEILIRSVADKGKLSIFDDQNKPEMGKLVNVSIYNEKVVIGWSKMTKNRVVKYQNQPHEYEQMTTVFYLDGSSEELDYVMFHRDRMMVKAIVEAETLNTKTQKTILKVATKDHGTFEIDTTFIN